MVYAAHNSIYRAGIIQAVGRQGQFQRSLSDTCAAWVMANVIMDRPMNTIRPWAMVSPGRLHKQILAGAVITNAAHMPLIHPTIYASEAAAESSRWRENGTVDGMAAAAKPIFAMGERPSFLITYQPEGQGQRISSAVCWEGEETALRDKLEAALGAMKGWRVTRFTRGREVPCTQPFETLKRQPHGTSPEAGEGACRDGGRDRARTHQRRRNTRPMADIRHATPTDFHLNGTTGGRSHDHHHQTPTPQAALPTTPSADRDHKVEFCCGVCLFAVYGAGHRPRAALPPLSDQDDFGWTRWTQRQPEGRARAVGPAGPRSRVQGPHARPRVVLWSGSCPPHRRHSRS